VNLENAGMIKDVITDLGGRPTDDKTYIMERVIRLASQLPLAFSCWYMCDQFISDATMERSQVFAIILLGGRLHVSES
jgi:hypothetical protein